MCCRRDKCLVSSCITRISFKMDKVTKWPCGRKLWNHKMALDVYAHISLSYYEKNTYTFLIIVREMAIRKMASNRNDSIFLFFGWDWSRCPIVWYSVHRTYSSSSMRCNFLMIGVAMCLKTWRQILLGMTFSCCPFETICNCPKWPDARTWFDRTSFYATCNNSCSMIVCLFCTIRAYQPVENRADKIWQVSFFSY